MKYLVRDIMTTNPVSIQESVSVKNCAEMMTEKEVGSLLVMNKKTFVGIITEQDLVIKVVSAGIDPKRVLVREIMTPVKKLVTVEPGRGVYTAMNLMNDNDVRRLPVMENDVLQGIITMKDIFGIEPDLLDHMFNFLPEEQKEI